MKNNSFFRSKLIIFSILCLTTLYAQESSIVSIGSDGKLDYTRFAMEGQNNEVNTVPDFSFAGYKKGGVALPDVPIVVTLSPINGDAHMLIQDAINEVSAMPLNSDGFRGTILLKAGEYKVNGKIIINKNGVVLRGEGQGTNGTVLRANLREKHSFITIKGSGSIEINQSSTQRITSAYVPVGSNRFNVANASSYSVGDNIVVTRTPNQQWLEDLGVTEEKLCGNAPAGRDCIGWTTSRYTTHHERVITRINNNQITVDLPIVDVMENKYGGGQISKVASLNKVNNVGIENLRVESFFASSTDENHAWSAIEFNWAENCWAKQVTAKYLGYGCVTINNRSNFNTIEECAAKDHKSRITGGRRYSFNINTGTGNLFQRCYSADGRHDFVTGSTVRGPNVWLDCYAEISHSDIGPHQRWATGTLYDNVYGGEIRARNRGWSGTGHGWAGNTQMFWNTVSDENNRVGNGSESGLLQVDSPTGGISWAIGSTAKSRRGRGFFESNNNPVRPRSLYLKQLEDRLGARAVENITKEPQRDGDIYDELKKWTGDGRLFSNDNDDIPKPIVDAYVRDGSFTNNNFGDDTTLVVKGNSADGFNRSSFIKYDLRQLGSNVPRAIVQLKVKETNSPNVRHTLYLASHATWKENSLNNANKPEATVAIETKAIPNVGEFIEFDVTSQVNELLLNGISYLSLVIAVETGNNKALVSYHSTEAINMDDRPKLAIRKITPDNKNIALNKPAMQSSIDFGGVPSRAVDGNINGVFQQGSVTHTNNEIAWWKVDLKDIYDVTEIHVYNRTECCEDRLLETAVYVGNIDSTDPNDYTKVGDLKNLRVNSFVGEEYRGRYVLIHKDDPNVLSLAEVEVQGIATTLSVDNHDSETPKLNIIPNPVRDKFTLRIEGSEKISVVQIHDITGRAVISYKKEDLLKPIDVSSMASGVYILAVKTFTGNTHIERFVKN